MRRYTSAAPSPPLQAQLLLEYGSSLRGLGAIEGGALGTSESATGLAVWGASTAAYEQAAQVCGGEGGERHQAALWL